jgi:hypothetical protein
MAVIVFVKIKHEEVMEPCQAVPARRSDSPPAPKQGLSTRLTGEIGNIFQFFSAFLREIGGSRAFELPPIRQVRRTAREAVVTLC